MKPFFKILFLLQIILSCKAQNTSHSKYFSLQDSTFYNGQILLPHIRYQLGKPNIDTISFPALDSIAAFLNQHSNIKMEVNAHLDCRANPCMCTNLSQGRAQSIVDYLIKKGINIERLIAKGYSDRKPFVLDNGIVLTCDYIKKLPTKEEREKAHAKNRRTELKIISQ